MKDVVVCGLQFFLPVNADRKDFISEFVEKTKEICLERGIDISGDNAPLLSIVLSCGSRVDFKTAEDIPLVDYPCPCGNPNHWTLKWGEIK